MFDPQRTDGTFGYVRSPHPKLLRETPQLCETSLPPYRFECHFEIRLLTRASIIAPEGVLCAAKCDAIATAN